MTTTLAIKRALISVSDKSGVVELARFLASRDVKILSTGGTAKLLAENGIKVVEVGDYTGFPEMMDGRVKTLHPKVHGGILARRDLAHHTKAMQEHEIPPIDMVVVNLYPFAATVAKPDCSFDDAIENIDIGGPAMVRASAKNHAFVAIVNDTADYGAIIDDHATVFDTLTKNRVHWTHAAYELSHTYPYLSKEVLRKAYHKSLDAEYGTDDPRIKAVFNGNLDFVRSAGVWLEAKTLEVTLVDNDLPVVSLSAGDALAVEAPGTATNTGRFTFTRDGSLSAPLTVLCTVGGSAINGTDYSAISTPVILPAGSNTKDRQRMGFVPF